MSSKLDLRAPLLAGLVATVTGLAASIGVVLSALKALGASTSQIGSGITIMLVFCGVLGCYLSWRYRMPITIVWSTPGAALLVASGAMNLGYANAVGAFLVTGLLLTLTGLWPALGALVSRIPKPIASAMLAGVIFSFCSAPFKMLPVYPIIIGPALLIWILLYRFATVWASPVAVAWVFGSTALTLHPTVVYSSFIAPLEFVNPTFSIEAVIGIAVPLYLVTMASQNIPGIAIMKSFGYEVPFKPSMLLTGISTALGSVFSTHAVNLAAISASLNANEHVHQDRSKRWVASFTGGVIFLALALAVGPFVGFVLSIPNELILAAAGIALFATIVSSLTATLEDASLRLPAVIAFLVGASGITLLGIGAGFWALLSGVLLWQALSLGVKKNS